jgi:hypothetical protein
MAFFIKFLIFLKVHGLPTSEKNFSVFLNKIFNKYFLKILIKILYVKC